MTLSFTTTITSFIFFFSLFSIRYCSVQSWIKVGYYYTGRGYPIAHVNSSLYSHLICAFAQVNSSSFDLSLSSSHTLSSSDSLLVFSSFPSTVKLKNPNVTTLLSIAGGSANESVVSQMVKSPPNRKSFIDSSISTARLHGYDGLDFCWVSISTHEEATALDALLGEWRKAISTESKKSNKTELILTLTVLPFPLLDYDESTYPIESMNKNLNWINVMAYNYYMPTWYNFTGAFAALYDPKSERNTDYAIKAWITDGIPANKLVLALPFYGYAWTLTNSSNDSSIGAPANGVGITDDGSMSYKEVKDYIKKYKGVIKFDGDYVMNYCVIGSFWIAFDDVEVVKTKVDYAKKMGLLGYFVWQVAHDDNWVLSMAAYQEGEKIKTAEVNTTKSGEDTNVTKSNADPKITKSKHHNNRKLLLVILLATTATLILILGAAILLYRRIRKRIPIKADVNDDPQLCVFSFTDIAAATNDFAFRNKLGEGGYGPVYKGTLQSGQEIAVKRLSKTSRQGFEEFKNEVMLTAKLQHVNLVRVLGSCIEKQEQILIYEFMPNKSLDHYIFGRISGIELDWDKRVHIIEGIIQGLLYLQEYSRLKIIHRDLKASNILLDNEMRPKIADFGMARIFQKDELEANTSRVVGTIGFVLPEYARHGIYSTKSDVYSFGVLLLQIISGKITKCLYGLNQDVHLLEYAYDLWIDCKYVEFTDPSLDDTSSKCKLMRCMHIALLCVQEDSKDRPTVLEVWSMLKNHNVAINLPKRPAFYAKPDKKDDKGISKNDSGFEGWSVDNASITQLRSRS